MPPKLLFVVNNLSFFVSHRLAIGLKALDKGFDVGIVCPLNEDISKVEKMGFRVFPVSVAQQSHGVFAQLKFFYSVYRICKQYRPDICHCITLKTFLVAGMAARLAGIHKRIGSISGLGYFFMSETGKSCIARFLLRPFFKLSMSGNNAPIVIFQNEDDRTVLSNYARIDIKHTRLIRGSGVDLTKFIYAEEADGEVTVVLLSRMLKDKGVVEFVTAARQLREQGVEAQFVLAGLPDETNPASLTEAELKKWHDDNLVKWIGYCSDVPEFLKKIHIVVLPSYREGFPKVLIEAAASGRATVTTDVPGCRDAIKENVTGLLIPVGEVEPLASAIKTLVEDKDARKTMGLAGSELAKENYSLVKVVDRHMEIYEAVGQFRVKPI